MLGFGRTRKGTVGPDRRSTDLLSAVRLEWATVGWMALEFASAVALGWAAKSLLLVAFGLDSAVELASGVLVLRRFRDEYRGPSPGEEEESSERRTAAWTGYLLWALAAYVVATSTYGLAVGHKANTDQSVWGLAIGVVAIVGMPGLAAMKRRLASPSRLDSRALRADAAEAIGCAYLSAVLILGLVLGRVLGWWWLDSAAALLLVPFLVLEGREAVLGEDE
jgi:divalent metal cation (Fe/Co/Zn/Cd) transporter